MTALPGFGSEASALVALRAAVDLGEALAVFGALAPATRLASLVARRALALRTREVVRVHVARIRAGDDFVPLDRFHVTQVVVVQHADASRQNVCDWDRKNSTF